MGEETASKEPGEQEELIICLGGKTRSGGEGGGGGGGQTKRGDGKLDNQTHTQTESRRFQRVLQTSDRFHFPPSLC